jgi:hypothetical protein
MTMGINDTIYLKAIQGGNELSLCVKAACVDHQAVNPKAGGKIHSLPQY